MNFQAEFASLDCVDPKTGLLNEKGRKLFDHLGVHVPKLEQNPQVTDLTPGEVEVATRLLSHVGTQRTGTDLFEAIWRVVPMAPSEQVVVRKIDGRWRGLMWERPANDHNYPQFFKHFPGGYPLVGESDKQWITRVLEKEVGVRVIDYQFVRRFNTRPETGWVKNHQMANMFLCEVEGEPTKGEYVPLDSPPEKLLGHHKKYVDCVRAFLLRRETMCDHGIRWDGYYRATEWKWVCATYDELRSKRFYHEVDTLDEALAYLYSNGEKGRLNHLFDDQGQQIL